MSHAAAEACTQLLAAGRGTGIGLQHVNDDQSAQHDKNLDGSSGEAIVIINNQFVSVSACVCLSVRALTVAFFDRFLPKVAHR